MAGLAEPRLVLIAGAGRSGSTLLGDAIAQAAGGFHAGELRFVPRDVLARERVCGCGTRLADCETWRRVLALAFDGCTPAHIGELARFSEEGMRYRSAALFALIGQTRMRRPVGAIAERYAAALRRLYLAIAEVTGTATIVDSSKIAMHVQLAARFSGLGAHVVHLVRDPRAMAYSWRRSSIDGVTFNPARASLSWTASNLAAGAFDRPGPEPGYTLVRYEDFARSPRDTLLRLAGRLGLPESRLPLIDERTLELEPNHTVAGNPGRFRSGRVAMRPDEEWRERMAARDRLLATLPATPLLGRYRYPLRLPAGSRSQALADGLAR